MDFETRSIRSNAGGTRSITSKNSKRGAAGKSKASKYRKNVNKSPSHNSGKKPGNRKHGIAHKILFSLLALFVLGIVAVAGTLGYMYATTEIPKPESIALAQKTTVYYADGTTPIGSYAEQNREIIDCSTLPKYVGNAIISSENRTFYQDSGIDFRGIGRAFLNNVTKGTRQGGSTITQQYAERYYLGETTSYAGKLREAILSLKIAQTENKDTVLCNYMNTIYLGRGAYGIEAAAKAYFNKDAKDLTISEAAMLAGIVPSPTYWDPAVNEDEAKLRFTRVIRIMREDNHITAKQAKDASMPQSIAPSTQNAYAGQQGYLLRMVKDELISSKAFTESELDTGGYKITTTIDKAKQDLMFQTASPSTKNGELPAGLEVGGVSVDPKTGAIISLYAGDDYLKRQLNNASQSTFQVGSTMKVFTLLGAIQDDVSLNTYFNGNSPRTFSSVGKAVANDADISYGYINLYTALANSVNTVFMDLNEHVTPAKTASIAKDAGIQGTVDSKSTFNTLGVVSLSVMDLARGYSTLANDGAKPTLHIVASVQNQAGKEQYKASTDTSRVFDANDVALLQKAMTGVIQNGTGTPARSIGKTMAGKSGTANDNTAAAFVGFTPSTLTAFGLWYPSPTGGAEEVPTFLGYPHGSGYPTTLFARYMAQALEGVPDQSFPTATDTGKVGGPDGSWGAGSNYGKRTVSPTPTASPSASQSASVTASPSASATSPAPSSSQPTASLPTTTPMSTEPTTTEPKGAQGQQGGSGN
ncbi:transglycosylase domain-containing protein [Bifidobacterium aquikefiricola]|uniref:Transglycosylase domain-containing protein n=1 Tax=Bifidobacterium aquikefiricola TaxID=3059038 RepID=A0AB39U7P7_9BIFI